MTTEPQTNQQILDALEVLLRRAKERSCPCIRRVPSSACNECSTILHNYSHGEWCEVCNGTGTITDPRYQAAWELLIEPWRPIPHGDVLYRPRMVEFWPDCAVVGLLEGAVRKLHDPKLYAYLINWKRGNNPIPEEPAASWFMKGLVPFHWSGPDDVQGLGKALLEWLEKEALNV